MTDKTKNHDIRKEVTDSFKTVALHGSLWATEGCLEKIGELSHKVQKKFKEDPNYDPLKDISRTMNTIVGDIATAGRPDVMVMVDHTGTSVDSSVLEAKLAEAKSRGGSYPSTVSVQFTGWLTEDWLRCPDKKPVDKLAAQVCEKLILSLMPELEPRVEREFWAS
jgi:hypothetical protein